MEKLSEIIDNKNITIPQDAKYCSIVLYIDSASAGQSYTNWDLSSSTNSLAFANNQANGYAYVNNGIIYLRGVTAYVVFFK